MVSYTRVALALFAAVALANPIPADDASLIGQKCGNAICTRGFECCNYSCSTCVPKGGACTQQVCELDPPPKLELCGKNVCGVGEYCCNESCGQCAPLGGACTEQFCEPELPVREQCGKNLCEVGDYCCNESCSQCAPKGGACTTQVCDAVEFSKLI